MHKQLRCRNKHMKFLCPRQFLCLHRQRRRKRSSKNLSNRTKRRRRNQCLACVNPDCVTGKDGKITKMILTAQNATEQEDFVHM